MEYQQDIGGAQALLLLGTKDNKSEDHDGGEHDHVQNHLDLSPSHSPVDLEDKANQQLNDAVEAAVMRYVGGTLEEAHGNDHDSVSLSHHHHHHHHDEHMRDSTAHDQDPNVTLSSMAHLASSDLSNSPSKRRLNHDDIMSHINEYHWDRFLQDDVTEDFERSLPKRKKTKTYNTVNDIDPELADLDSATSEHDQLVHAAIMGAGELAKQLLFPSSLSLQPSTSGNESSGAMAKPDNESTAINQLAHAASALSEKGDKNQNPLKSRRSIKKSASPQFRQPLAHMKYTNESVEALVEEAANEALQWYHSQHNFNLGGPRPFSQEEIRIVDKFIEGYCRIHNLSRVDICRRIWSNERAKDNLWEHVSKVMPYRTRASVYKHVRRQYHVFDIRAKWTKEEDDLLRKLALSVSANWKKIGETMKRMPEDCRDRWRNYLKCGENRALNKWSEEEEATLRNIVVEMITTEALKDKPYAINWTTVSERMNGVRSRIQCRYKWNKLLRRESLSRITLMDNETRVWLLNRLLDANFPDADSIDWEYMLHVYYEEHKDNKEKDILWSAMDLQVAFESMKSSIKDNRSHSLHSVLAKLLSNMFETTPGLVGPPKSDGVIPVEDQAASIANATVAAVSTGVNENDAHPQEYSLWR